MYGGSGKLRRGGGRTGGNLRMSYPPPSSVRPPGRLGPVGGGPTKRLSSSVNSDKLGSAAASAVAVEEQFSLAPGSNPLAFAMIIRLTPDLVEEIRKVEAQGGSAMIKFDANANNTSENVIDVGGKDFRFTWSREMGGLCDVYEERESGKSRDGLLVESSRAWRKLNVQRVLDESTTSHVKMRSVEAELKHKSRQAIVLDHGNPAAKNQLKLLAAAESNPSRNSYKQNKEPHFKKRKFDSSPGGGSSRTLSQKPVLSSSASMKSTRSASPLLSTNRIGGSVSPCGASKVIIKNHASLDDPRSYKASSKEDKLSSEKEGTGKAAYVMHGNKGKGSADSVDLHSKLVSILTENPKGMTVKALEVAVGDAFPNASKEIELIVGSIATFQPSSGRYVLKQGTESESCKDQFSEIEGLREDNLNQMPHVPKRTHQQSSAPEACCAEKLYSEENQEHVRFNSRQDSTTVEKRVLVHNSDPSGHPRSPDKSDDRAGSSSNGGSDSDTDSRSDSESKSKSPVGSGSSSDSDSDASKNSKEGSDEDVDIISEDEKEEKDKLASSGQVLSSSHVPWKTPDGRPSQNSMYDDNEYYGPVRVEVEKILPDEDEDIEIDVASDTTPHKENDKSQMLSDLSLPTHGEHHEYESYGDRIGRQKVSCEEQPGQLSNNQPPNTMPLDQKGIKNKSNSASKNKVRDDIGCGPKNSDRSSQLSRGFPSQYNKSYGDSQNEDVGIRNNYSDSRSNKPEAVGQYMGAQQVSKSSFASSPKADDRYPFINGQSRQLRRELSDLEMEGLRESVSEDPLEINKKFEREGSFKKVNSKQGMSDNKNIDPNKLIPVTKEPIEQGKIASPTSNSRAPKNPDGLLKKRATDKTKRPQQRTASPQARSHLDIDQVTIDKKLMSSKTKPGDKRREVPQANANSAADLIEENDALFPEQKRRESSSDENSCSFTKYEKNEPDLRGPIKDFSQYKEYVQEYNSKYDIYYSLNENIESYRSEFQKLAKEIENAKEKDEEKYNNALSRLMDSYRQSGAKHKRLKKIFLIFHEELKNLKEMITDFATAYTKD